MGELHEVENAVARVLRDQAGVITRRQALDCGLNDTYIRRMVRQGRWVAVYPGVYVTHNGPLTYAQRVWCAVLDAQPAALSHQTALHAVSPAEYPIRSGEPIQLAVPNGRRPVPRPGVVVHQRRKYTDTVLTHVMPPRVMVDEAVLDVAAAATSELGAISALATAVQARLTTADRLLTALSRRPRIGGRRFLRDVLTDVASGVCSALEHRYLTRVERAHGLPKGVRQAPTEVGRRGFRDVKYRALGIVVELDGRLFHSDPAARDRDLERDLDAAVDADLLSVRLGWMQSTTRACGTARKLGRLFRKHGWTSRPTPCASPDCVIRRDCR